MLTCRIRQQRWSNMRMAAHFNLMGMTMTMQAKQTDLAAGRQAGRQMLNLEHCNEHIAIEGVLSLQGTARACAQCPLPGQVLQHSTAVSAPCSGPPPCSGPDVGTIPPYIPQNHGYCRHQPRTDRREQAHTFQAGSLVYIVLHVSCVLFQRQMPCSRLADAVC